MSLSEKNLSLPNTPPLTSCLSAMFLQPPALKAGTLWNKTKGVSGDYLGWLTHFSRNSASPFQDGWRAERMSASAQKRELGSQTV